MEPYEFILKVSICGQMGVGKTSLLKRYTEGDFQWGCVATVGVDLKMKVVDTKDGRKLQMQIWDLAGQENFRTVTKSYFNGKHAYVFVFDVQSKESLQKLKGWMETARWCYNGNEERYERENVQAFLIGTKSDLMRNLGVGTLQVREISKETATLFAQNYNMTYHEVSAFKDEGVTTAFNAIRDRMTDLDAAMFLDSGKHMLSRSTSYISLGANDDEMTGSKDRRSCC